MCYNPGKTTFVKFQVKIKGLNKNVKGKNREDRIANSYLRC